MTTPDLTPQEDPMHGKFEVYPARDGHRWRLVSADGDVVFVSGRGWATSGDAVRDAELAQEAASGAEIREVVGA